MAEVVPNVHPNACDALRSSDAAYPQQLVEALEAFRDQETRAEAKRAADALVALVNDGEDLPEQWLDAGGSNTGVGIISLTQPDFTPPPTHPRPPSPPLRPLDAAASHCPSRGVHLP